MTCFKGPDSSRIGGPGARQTFLPPEGPCRRGPGTPCGPTVRSMLAILGRAEAIPPGALIAGIECSWERIDERATEVKMHGDGARTGAI